MCHSSTCPRWVPGCGAGPSTVGEGLVLLGLVQKTPTTASCHSHLLHREAEGRGPHSCNGACALRFHRTRVWLTPLHAARGLAETETLGYTRGRAGIGGRRGAAAAAEVRGLAGVGVWARVRRERGTPGKRARCASAPHRAPRLGPELPAAPRAPRSPRPRPGPRSAAPSPSRPQPLATPSLPFCPRRRTPAVSRPACAPAPHDPAGLHPPPLGRSAIRLPACPPLRPAPPTSVRPARPLRLRPAPPTSRAAAARAQSGTGRREPASATLAAVLAAAAAGARLLRQRPAVGGQSNPFLGGAQTLGSLHSRERVSGCGAGVPPDTARAHDPFRDP